MAGPVPSTPHKPPSGDTTGGGGLLVWVTLDAALPAVRDMLAGLRARAERAGATGEVPGGVTLRLVPPGAVRRVPREVDGCVGQVRSPALAAFARSRPAVSVYSLADVPAGRRVYSDPVAGARLAFDHFADRDVRRLRTYLCRPVGGARRERAEAFEAVARAAGCEVERFEPPGPDIGPADRACVGRLARWLARQPRPVGVMAVDDWHGLHVAEAAAEARLRVPDDVAILGHNDDRPVCEFCRPPLSSVATDQRRIGAEAMGLLLRLIAGRPAPGRPTLVPPAGVVSRASSDVQHTADPVVADALRFIRDRLADGVTPADVLRHVPASASTVRRRFLAHRGHGVAEALRRARLDRVERLLLAGDAPLADVAAGAGYEHVSQLCRDFKRRTGRTPGEFRAARRGA